MAEFARNLQQAQRHVATLGTHPAMAEFADVEAIAEEVLESPARGEFTRKAAVAAVEVAEIAEAEGLLEGEFEVYDFSALLAPSARKPIQASMAVVVFLATFSFVLDNFNLASSAGTLIGTSPLWAAQVAWTLCAGRRG